MSTFPESNASLTSQHTEQRQFVSAPSTETPAVITHDLVRTFGQKVAVNRLNLTVQRGEFYGFLGPNGAGKSTTIKMLTGLLRPTSGSVFVGGVDVWRDPLQARALMGVLPEYLNLYERLTGREFLTFAGHMYGVSSADIQRRSEQLLQVLTLADDADKLVVDYSVGMR
ncbi:MAG TPA: ABC transporter ATP-binding protein, partial [Ktedonobacteraceae bacterium]|nr:ABC transporter ATP-binding protein [Ktedonobacteraceae bacterium]